MFCTSRKTCGSCSSSWLTRLRTSGQVGLSAAAAYAASSPDCASSSLLLCESRTINLRTIPSDKPLPRQYLRKPFAPWHGRLHAFRGQLLVLLQVLALRLVVRLVGLVAALAAVVHQLAAAALQHSGTVLSEALLADRAQQRLIRRYGVGLRLQQQLSNADVATGHQVAALGCAIAQKHRKRRLAAPAGLADWVGTLRVQRHLRL
mmetsp:Transcript_4420/g.17388  ORF Transcript_4420/g.17388 Transcript_4420/m.17388 type:complete len:205 (+) Transcript_4420:1872-2486(+)